MMRLVNAHVSVWAWCFKSHYSRFFLSLVLLCLPKDRRFLGAVGRGLELS